MTRLLLAAIYTLCIQLLCMDSALLYAQNDSGIQMTLNSWYWAEGQEGFNLDADSTLELATLMGEPVVKSVSAWNFEGNAVYSVQVYFIPYGETEMTIRNVSLDKAREMIRPYAYRVKVKLPNNNFIEFDPGALASVPEKPSFNAPGSPQWDRLFYHSFKSDETYLSKARAVALFKWLKARPNLEVYAELIDVKYDLTALKHEFALEQYEKRKANYAQAARKFYARVMDQFNIDKSMLDDFDKEIKDYSPELLKQSVLSIMQTIQSGKD